MGTPESKPASEQVDNPLTAQEIQLMQEKNQIKLKQSIEQLDQSISQAETKITKKQEEADKIEMVRVRHEFRLAR